jgi:hypothetical protein
LFADVNRDGFVDIDDLTSLILTWGIMSMMPMRNAKRRPASLLTEFDKFAIYRAS